MKICILNTGSPQAIYRAIAISKYANVINFIELRQKKENHNLLGQNDIPVLYFKTTKVFRFIALWKFLKNINADIFLCNFAKGIHLQACLLARKSHVAVIAMGHDILDHPGESEVKRNFVLKKIVRMCVRKADYISAKSKFVINRLKEWNVSNTIKLNYWGSDLNYFQSEDKLTARKRLGLQDEGKIILSPRIFSQRLNIHIITEAFIRISKKRQDIVLVYIGSPVKREYVNSIKKRLEEEDCIDRARFDFEVPINKVVDYYNAADVAISIAKSEGFPNTILELLACKIPVISSKIPQTKEILEDKKNVIFCKQNAEDLAQKILWVLSKDNAEKCTEIINNGYLTVKEVGDINKNAQQFLSDLEIELKNEKKKNKRFPYLLLCLLILEGVINKVRKFMRLIHT